MEYILVHSLPDDRHELSSAVQSVPYVTIVNVFNVNKTYINSASMI